jgi:peptidoglycan/xylan/chitin deacetylase (PgdA/CDA1 family)
MKLRLAARRLAFSAATKGGLSKWLRQSATKSVTTLLFHRFFDPGEPKNRGLDRLRRQLEWLRTQYTPLSLSQFTRALQTGAIPDRSLLLTCDDGLIQLKDVVDEFKAFEMPMAVFVCAGWSAVSSRGTGHDLLARAAAAIQWYEGPDTEIGFGRGRSLALSPSTKASNIDFLIAEKEALLPDLPEFCAKIESLNSRPRQCCTWSELRDLQSAGFEMGAHSVTHVWMSTTSDLRRQFEIHESKRVCEALLGRCESFAYPFGMKETQSEATKQELIRAGYQTAFLTHSEFTTATNDPYRLPRISMPDGSIPFPEFQARASGVGVLVRTLKMMGRTDQRRGA